MLAANAGEHGNQAHCGIIQCLTRFMANPTIRQQRLGWLSQDYSVSDRADVLFFVGCAPYLEHVFTFDVKPLDIARATLRILNASGIRPAVLPDEKCCGHDALWTGDIELFQKLAEHNAVPDKGVGSQEDCLLLSGVLSNIQGGLSPLCDDRL
jgi:heterodisulfide reductase subunit D